MTSGISETRISVWDGSRVEGVGGCGLNVVDNRTGTELVNKGQP